MAQTFTLELTLYEYANLITLTDLIARELMDTDDNRLYFREKETKEIRQRTAAAVKTLMQEDPE